MMQTYPALVDSGLDWLGKIPVHWETVKAKWLFASISEKNFPEEPLLSATQEFGVVPRDILEDRVMMPMGELVHFKLVQRGDFVISLRSFQGGIEYSDYRGLVSPAYTVLRNTKPINKAYFRYLMKSFPFISELQTSVTGIREGKNINYKDFAEIIIPNPPLEEQARIANFIEEQTAVIDQFINNKRRLIALLEEQKQVVINTAVTQGLDPNAPRKPSGIEWLEEIPSHWNRIAIKFTLHNIIDTEHKTAPFYDDGKFLVARTSNIKQGKLILNDAKYTNEAGYKEWTRRGRPEPGDIIFTREAPAGEACIVPEEPVLCLGQRTVLFKVDHSKLVPEFGVYSIYGGAASQFIMLLSQGSTVAHFNMGDIGSIPMLIPPLKEQQEIVAYLDGKTGEIEATIERAQREIDLIEEYRTTLIAHAVTGKIDVRGAA